ncbi:D-alanyl-D-alanine carboxypeptidase [Alkalibacillus flavidus]|uniref:D-alanyl-D-alanine carboxypeptidase n=1 Tax=Alkalibacillus flavidus TaxID=546021 RepID=A0ABV2KXX1_9BACI
MKRLISILGMVCILVIISACQNDTETKIGQEALNTEESLEEKSSIDVQDDNENESTENDGTEPDDSNSNESESNDQESNNTSESDEQGTNDSNNSNETTNENDAVVVDDPTAMDVVVNKDRKLPEGYEPPDLTVPDVEFHVVAEERKYMRAESANALESLFQAASEAGHQLVGISGYRSQQTQAAVFASNVERNGREHALQYSAQPGHSEHQTGLTMDVSTASNDYALTESFGQTPAGQWVADHAHEHGFVIRYPKGKSHITGYGYEPWHLRYFGESIATEIYEAGLTVEEYYGLVE